jgi:pimeloyl-ACP methyl ester carboxylesterase
VKKVSFKNRRGQTLAGVLHGEPGPAMVISCHGMLSTKEGDKHKLLGGALEALGLPMLRFDFAGRGESEGELYDMTYTNEMHDLDAAVEFLAGLGAERVGVFGSSMGGAVALLAGARDERIAAIATLAAVGHTDAVTERHPHECRAWQERGYIELVEGRIGRTFLDDSLAHDVLSAVRILHAPLLVIHGEQDDIVPCSDAHDIAATARNATLDLVVGADHRFTNPVHLRPVLAQIARFFVDKLGA